MKRENYTKVYTFAILLVAFTLPWSIRLNSYACVLAMLIWLCDKQIGQKVVVAFQSPITKWMVLFFICHVLSAMFSANTKEGWAIVERRSALLVMPFLIGGSGLEGKHLKKIALTFVVAVCMAALVCLLYALFQYASFGNGDVFFYQTLTTAIGINAVYLALYTIVSIHILLYFRESIQGWLWKSVIIFLVFFCFLLNSKMMLVAGCLSAGIFFFWQYPRRKALQMGVAGVVVVLLIVVAVPKIKQRVVTEFNSHWEVVHQTTFNYDTPFTGTSLRLVFWRYAFEVLNEHEAWWLGVSTGDFQDLLNQKYKATGIYTGYPDTADKGYLGYGPHNQFIELLLSMGVVGLLVFIGLLFQLVQRLRTRRNYLALQTLVLFGMFFMTESALSTQKGIVLFCLMIMLFDRLAEFKKV